MAEHLSHNVCVIAYLLQVLWQQPLPQCQPVRLSRVDDTILHPWGNHTTERITTAHQGELLMLVCVIMERSRVDPRLNNMVGEWPSYMLNLSSCIITTCLYRESMGHWCSTVFVLCCAVFTWCKLISCTPRAMFTR